MKLLLGIIATISLSQTALGQTGLVIHAAEFGVGKFHRIDNKKHPYATNSAWFDYILPDGDEAGAPIVNHNQDGSYTVFFSTLDDLISSTVDIVKQTGQSVAVFNVHAHGEPGGMGFPATQDDLQASYCRGWRNLANSSDEKSYVKYYDAVTMDEVDELEQIASEPLSNPSEGCQTGLPEWQNEVEQSPDFKSVFTADTQIHFPSCLVGLGEAGKEFTEGIAELLLPPGQNDWVVTSASFGLGDWSLPEGMGFWNVTSEKQLDHDDAVYARDKKDAEIAQKGTVRVATYDGNAWTSRLVSNQEYMLLQAEKNPPVSTTP